MKIYEDGSQDDDRNLLMRILRLDQKRTSFKRTKMKIDEDGSQDDDRKLLMRILRLDQKRMSFKRTYPMRSE